MWCERWVEHSCCKKREIKNEKEGERLVETSLTISGDESSAAAEEVDQFWNEPLRYCYKLKDNSMYMYMPWSEFRYVVMAVMAERYSHTIIVLTSVSISQMRSPSTKSRNVFTELCDRGREGKGGREEEGERGEMVYELQSAHTYM